ncbi:guanylate kinase [Candidatus Phytoplasma oryzae]|uniref:Guanylate kinase n=1 Tax=Candidatus Phytoplasma oryzae TaxID=203274 RepID=A0A328IKF9_9MOLU|nr:guanylate kinase [Candidatus Phytoplasma oryzae]RAM57790.1 guanylate kinase [Candidatus Phytoplasma oryzae]
MKLHKKGLMIVISGPSGAGKGTILKSLFQRKGHNFSYSVSMTSRPPRSYERNQKDYFFVTKEQFKKKIKENYFLEYKKFVHNYYGTPYKKLLEKLKKGKEVILELDIQGALEIRKHELNKNSVLIFITPPSKQHLYKRLIKRNTEIEEVLKKRLKKADEEFKLAYKYDYIVVNDEVENAVDKIISIIVAEHSKTKNSISYYLEKILKEKR